MNTSSEGVGSGLRYRLLIRRVSDLGQIPVRLTSPDHLGNLIYWPKRLDVREVHERDVVRVKVEDVALRGMTVDRPTVPESKPNIPSDRN